MEGYPLSPQQVRAWTLEGSEASTPRIARCLVQAPADLDADRLEAALGELQDRHEILRTGFQLLPGLKEPVQVLEPPRREVTEEAVGIEELARRIDGIGETPASGEAWPGLRAVLGAPSGEHRGLLLELPALCIDDRSWDRLTQELVGALGGEVPADEPVQYADFADWQNEILEQDEARPVAQRWRTEDLESAARQRLPFESTTDEPGDPGRSFQPRLLRRSLGAAADLLAAAEEAGELNESAALMAAWGALLARRGGADRWFLAYAADGRPFDDLATALGPFEKQVPVELAIAAESFTALSRRSARALAEVSEWQELFDPALLEARPRDGAGEFFLPCGFSYRRSAPLAGGWRLEGTSAFGDRFDLRLAARRCGDRLDLTLAFDPALVKPADAELLLDQYRRFVDAAARQPSGAPADLEAPRGEALAELLRTTAEGAPLECAASLLPQVEEQLDARGDAAAVTLAGKSLSYRELGLRARALARRLRSLGVGAETRVGVYLERSLEQVESVLAVLLAGGTYVPLDPAYPRARLEHMVRDSGVEVLMLRRDAGEQLEVEVSHRLVVDEPGDAALVAQGDDEEPWPPAQPLVCQTAASQAAYVIYTSGSTGEPKGVVVTHGNLAASTAARQAFYSAPERSPRCPPLRRFLLLSSLSFDSSVAGFFWSLVEGATLCLTTDEEVQSPISLARRIAEDRITHLLAVPSLYAEILPFSNPEDGLEVAIVAGESCPASLVEEHRRRLPKTGLFNEYGPTEGTVWATAEDLLRPPVPGRVTLGGPIPGARVLVADHRLAPVPTWCSGEIFIGGPGVARGYQGRARATARRFLPDPWSPEPGGRLYRTGDHARRFAGGSLEFLGRDDAQIKLRGYRIELGEIEAILRDHGGVAEAVVTVRGEAGAERLVAYLVPTPDSGLAVAEVRAAAQQRLPAYMVPAAWSILERLPRLPNGKVDLAALREPTGGAADAGAGDSPTAAMLRQLWCDLLGVETVSPSDDFFALGGHSLLATRLVGRVQELFGVQLVVRDLFDTPTLEQLVRRIDTGIAGPLAPPVVEPRPADEAPVLSFAQQRLWILERVDPGTAAFNLPAAVRLLGELREDLLIRGLHDAVARHRVLSSRITEEDGRPRLALAADAELAVARRDLSAEPEGQRGALARKLIDETVAEPFDLAAGPLLRALLLRLKEREHILVLVVHHIVADGWSVQVLVDECARCYQALVAGESWRPPELPVQYPDCAAAERAWLDGEVQARLQDYWVEQLRGAPEEVPLPWDRPREEQRSYRGRLHNFSLGTQQVQGVQELGRTEGATPFMVLLSALGAVLSTDAGQPELVLGVHSAHREQAATQRLVGLFANQLPLRLSAAGDPTFSELMAQVRQRLIGAFAHQGLPFDRIVEAVNPERSAQRTPLFNVAVSYQRVAEDSSVEAQGLLLEPVELDIRYSKLDLTLFLHEHAGGMAAAVNYSEELFNEVTVRALVERWLAFLAAAVEAPAARLSELALRARSLQQEEASAPRRRATRARSLADFLQTDAVGAGGDDR